MTGSQGEKSMWTRISYTTAVQSVSGHAQAQRRLDILITMMQRRDDKYASTKEKRTLQAVQKMSSLGKDVSLLSRSRTGKVKLIQPTSMKEQIRHCAPADRAYINASFKGAGKSLSHLANTGPKGHIGRPIQRPIQWHTCCCGCFSASAEEAVRCLDWEEPAMCASAYHIACCQVQ
ncbi:TPA: hypothetical protein ACH3X1_008662 [Trebouxia sp. C0004]